LSPFMLDCLTLCLSLSPAATFSVSVWIISLSLCPCSLFDFLPHSSCPSTEYERERPFF
jgi:hypothetical protein